MAADFRPALNEAIDLIAEGATDAVGHVLAPHLLTESGRCSIALSLASTIREATGDAPEAEVTIAAPTDDLGELIHEHLLAVANHDEDGACLLFHQRGTDDQAEIITSLLMLVASTRSGT